MSITHRIRRLEHAAGITGACRLCRGHGPLPTVLVWEKGKRKPKHPACPNCGALPGAYKMIIRGDARAA